jgi:3-hydroxyisobutyrate dehydrogenase
MVINLLKAGHTVTVTTRTKAKASDVLAAGAQWADSIADSVRGVDVVMTMVGYPADVEQVYLSPAGILASAKPGTLVIDFTTTKPTLAQLIAVQAKAKGILFLDAPVSGGDLGARNGTLSIMVGADPQVFAMPVVQGLFGAVGKVWVLQGPPGSGQHTKMCNQICIASGMLGVMESLLYARRAGLDPETVLRSISGGAAASWSLSNLAPRVLRGDFNPGFYVEHFIKDMGIALDECKRMGIEMPGLSLAFAKYQELAAKGGSKLGTQSIYLVLDPTAPFPAPK